MAQNKGAQTKSGLLCFAPGMYASLKLRVLYPALSNCAWPGLSIKNVFYPFNLVEVERA